MTRTRKLAALALVAIGFVSSLLQLGGMEVSGAAQTYGPYLTTASPSLNERSGPSTSSAVTGSLRYQSTIYIGCQTHGTVVNGSSIWDRLANGSYISDYWTNTPDFNTWSPPIPQCSAVSSAPTAPPPAPPSSDWAGASFCASNGSTPLGGSYAGVATCATRGPSTISYDGHVFDTDGFQCVELAARYFFFRTGHAGPLVPWASNIAYEFSRSFPQYGVYPAGALGRTSTYQSSLMAGDIISMWSNSNQVGHVAIVTAVQLNSTVTGTITILEENGSSSGFDTISVTKGLMSYSQGGYYYNYFQWLYGIS